MMVGYNGSEGYRLYRMVSTPLQACSIKHHINVLYLGCIQCKDLWNTLCVGEYI